MSLTFVAKVLCGYILFGFLSALSLLAYFGLKRDSGTYRISPAPRTNNCKTLSSLAVTSTTTLPNGSQMSIFDRTAPSVN